MTEIKQNGLVILEKDLPENDKLLVILTERYGKLPVIAKGVKSVKNRHIASCQLFSYASFGLRKRGNYYYITDSDLIENYYNIRNDIVRLALASYICDVVNDGIKGKLFLLNEQTQYKFRESLEKVVNKGHGGMLAIIL